MQSMFVMVSYEYHEYYEYYEYYEAEMWGPTTVGRGLAEVWGLASVGERKDQGRRSNKGGGNNKLMELPR